MHQWLPKHEKQNRVGSPHGVVGFEVVMIFRQNDLLCLLSLVYLLYLDSI